MAVLLSFASPIRGGSSYNNVTVSSWELCEAFAQLRVFASIQRFRERFRLSSSVVHNSASSQSETMSSMTGRAMHDSGHTYPVIEMERFISRRILRKGTGPKSKSPLASLSGERAFVKLPKSRRLQCSAHARVPTASKSLAGTTTNRSRNKIHKRHLTGIAFLCQALFCKRKISQTIIDCRANGRLTSTNNSCTFERT